MGLSVIERAKKKLTEWLTKEPSGYHEHLCDFERITYELRPCDVLLIEGRSRVSEIISSVTVSPWTHACLYIGRLHDIDNPITRQKIREYSNAAPDTQLLIESMLGKGIIITPLEHYRKSHIRICRPNGLSRKDSQEVIGYSVSSLGADYNVRHILDLARFLLPWRIIPRKWRSSLFEKNPSVPTEEICSSMIAKAFASVKYPILPVIRQNKNEGLKFIRRNPRLYTPSDFDYSPFFEIIKYPIIELSEGAMYKTLPWSEGEYHIDEDKR